MQISLSDQIWSGSKDAGCNVISHSAWVTIIAKSLCFFFTHLTIVMYFDTPKVAVLINAGKRITIVTKKYLILRHLSLRGHFPCLTLEIPVMVSAQLQSLKLPSLKLSFVHPAWHASLNIVLLSMLQTTLLSLWGESLQVIYNYCISGVNEKLARCEIKI